MPPSRTIRGVANYMRQLRIGGNKSDEPMRQRVVAGDIVAHQRAVERPEHAPGMPARAAEGDVVEHGTSFAFNGHEVRRAVQPHEGLLGLAAPGCGQRHWRLVGVQQGVAENATRLQAPRAQPHPHAVVHLHLQPVSAPVGEDVSVVRLCAASKAANHLTHQHIDAPAQVSRPERQPHHLDADHWQNSRNQVARSRAWLSGQCTSTLRTPKPIPSSTRMLAAVGAAGATDARTATCPLGCSAGASATPSSRARHRLACAHRPCNAISSTPLAAAQAGAFKPDAR